MALRLDAAHSVLKRTGIPDGWYEASVGDLARIVGGGTPDREQPAYWRNGTIPWITPTDLTANGAKYIASGSESISNLGLENSNATLVHKDSIVFSTRGTVGSMALAAVPLTCNQSCEIIVPKDGAVDAEFLYYILHYGLPAFIRLSGGTTFGAITRRDIARVRFAVPPQVNDQAAIARILAAVDTALELTRTAIDRARELRRSLIQELLARGLRKDHQRKSAAGLIPARWACDALGDHIHDGPTNGVYRPETDYATHGTHIVRIDDFADGMINSIQALRRVVVEPVVQRRYALVKNDVLINRVNSLSHIGKAALVPALEEAAIFESNMMRLRCGPSLLPAFLTVVLCSAIARKHWLARAKPAVNQASINQRDVCELSVPLPEIAEQQEIASIVSAAEKQIEMLLRVVDMQCQLKKSLMHDLLTGRVRVAGEPKAAAS
jgi:type I restriction enzyme S subunit